MNVRAAPRWFRMPLGYGGALALLLCAAAASAGSDAGPPQRLDPAMQKQVQSVARSLLRARRQAATASGASQPVRDHVAEVRQRLTALLAPIRRAPVVGSTAGLAAAASAPTWQAQRAARLEALEHSLDSLDAACRELRAERQAPRRAVTTQASEAALRRLESLRGEVSAALQRPDAERHAALAELARALEIRARATPAVREPEPAPAPTFRNRTRHR